MPSSSSRKAELERLGARPFAHRGLHGPGVPENSLAAFRAAIARGSGIELDVRLSRDGEAMVFHDETLERLTEAHGPVAGLTARELQSVRLEDEGIPTLVETLRLIDGRVPVLVEVKAPERSVGRLCAAVARALDAYQGPVGIMSFNPQVGRWFAAARPQALRGLVVTEQDKRGLSGRVERSLSLWWARADFLAYDIRDLPSPFASAARARGLALYSWTVRTPEERARAAAHADQPIFEEKAG